MIVCVCLSPFVILFTGPEPDRQVDLLERKHLISFLVRSLSYLKRRRRSIVKLYSMCLLKYVVQFQIPRDMVQVDCGLFKRSDSEGSWSWRCEVAPEMVAIP